MSASKDWFQVDRKGLAEIVERRGGKAWLIQELISNAWDETGVTSVAVSLVAEDNRPFVHLTVTDDAPNGFASLDHSWVLFAKSNKRGNADVRGRFNLGEKLVLAFCHEASIETTTGTVMFDARGRTINSKRKRAAGSEFYGYVRMTRAELDQATKDLARLIPPTGIVTTINGLRLGDREPVKEWTSYLWTELADDEGVLERRYRSTLVRAFRPLEGEVPYLYELGIPVVPLDGDPLHVDIRQKVPLNLERDNVTPSYLRDVRAVVLNNTHTLIEAEAMSRAWATDAMSDSAADATAVDAVLTARFGKERVTADPSDREAEDNCKSAGMTVVHGGSLPAAAWDRVRSLGLMQSAGKVRPTPKHFDDNAPPINVVDKRTLPNATQRGLLVYHAIAKLVLGYEITITVCHDPMWPIKAAWEQGRRRMILNVGQLDDFSHFQYRERIYALALHEMAHEAEGNHLSEKYHEEICRLAGLLADACESGKLRHEIDEREAEWYRPDGKSDAISADEILF